MAQSLIEIALNQPRKYLGNQFVYAIISQRAGGLSIGINMNPDKACNFDCLYCEVKRDPALSSLGRINVETMSRELKHLLAIVQLEMLHDTPQFSDVPESLLSLKQVSLSGDGEPTCCSNFFEIVEEISKIRVNPQFPEFKLVLITNGTGLHLESVRKGLRKFLLTDEIWIKLDAGSLKFMEFINRPKAPISMVLSNILALGQERPIVIQSLFSSILGKGPEDVEISAYIQRLNELKEGGAQISLVQIYSASRPPVNETCSHLPLKRLSEIARQVRENTGLKVEVF